MSQSRSKQEKKIDKGEEMSFPASDPPAYGGATGTEPPVARKDRKAPKITRQQIEDARRGAGHKSRDGD
jgi:hypothetical protein